MKLSHLKKQNKKIILKNKGILENNTTTKHGGNKQMKNSEKEPPSKSSEASPDFERDEGVILNNGSPIHLLMSKPDIRAKNNTISPIRHHSASA